MIEIQNLSFSYKKTQVFSDISLSFKEGNIYGLLGENGVGKTTLLKIITVETLQGCNYEELGVVSGSTIQSKNMFADFGQGLKSIVGGELKSYTGMMEKARAQATQRMVDQAVRLGADAIIGVRYTTSAIMAQAAEVLVYGTAVKYK